MFKYFTLICWFLLLGGKAFSKLNIGGLVYAHDMLLFLPMPFLIYHLKFYKSLIKNYLFTFISIIYLVFSFFNSSAPIEILLRQFMLFAYFSATLFYYNYFKQNQKFHYELKTFLNEFGILSLVIHVTFLAYSFFIMQDDFFEPDSYHYYSPISIIGVLIFGLNSLTLQQSNLKKIIIIISVSFLLSLTGHSSAFLSYLAGIFIFYYSTIPKIFKIFAFIAFICLLLWIIITVKSFTDVNAMWRLFYWGLTAKRIFIDNFGIFGMGFGVPYADENTAFFLEVLQGYTTNLQDETEKYLSPMHNSFLTIAFNLGGIIALYFIIFPIIRAIKNILKKGKVPIDHKKNVLVLASFSVWSSLNVVLELPHSAILFWLVFFSVIDFDFSYNKILS